MIKKGIFIGNIVELNNGKIGMVTWKKNNDEIGINISNYFLMLTTAKDKSKEEFRDTLISLGADDVFSKSEIKRIVRDNSCYSY